MQAAQDQHRVMAVPCELRFTLPDHSQIALLHSCLPSPANYAQPVLLTAADMFRIRKANGMER